MHYELVTIRTLIFFIIFLSLNILISSKFHILKSVESFKPKFSMQIINLLLTWDKVFKIKF